MLSAIATLLLMMLVIIFPLLIPIAVTLTDLVSDRRRREKPVPKPRLRIAHGFEQLSTSHRSAGLHMDPEIYAFRAPQRTAVVTADTGKTSTTQHRSSHV